MSTDEVVEQLLALAAELWIDAHPHEALILFYEGFATSRNAFLPPAENAICRAVGLRYGGGNAPR